MSKISLNLPKKLELEDFEVPPIGGLTLLDNENNKYGEVKGVEIPVGHTKVPNYHFMYNLLFTQSLGDESKKYSVTQLRFFDYIRFKIAANKKYNIEPNPTFGKDDEKSEKEKKEKEAAAAAKAADVVKDFSTVFNYQQSKPAQVNTAYPYYIPNPKVQQKDMETLSEASSDKTQQKKPDFYSKYSNQIISHQKVLASTEVSKNYDYLFESTISKTGQYNSVDKSPIVISEDQLICGRPMNSEVKIEVQKYENNIRLVREHFGTIDFSNPIKNIDLYDISSLVDIEENYVNIDCQKAKEYKVDLNQPAIVTLENVFPLPNSINYEASLRKYCLQNDLIFIHYSKDKGTLIFCVNNFENGPFQFPKYGENMKSILIKLTENMSASITRKKTDTEDSSVYDIEDFSVEGSLTVETMKKEKYAIELIMPDISDNFKAYPLNQEDQKLFQEKKELIFQNDISDYLFIQNLLEWKYEPNDENELPLNFSFDINNEERKDEPRKITTFECEVSVKDDLTFKNVVISINVPKANDAVVSLCYGEVKIMRSHIEWTINDIDQDSISIIKFSVPECDEKKFFPIDVKFKSESNYSGVDIAGIVKENENDKPFNDYDVERSFFSEQFKIK